MRIQAENECLNRYGTRGVEKQPYLSILQLEDQLDLLSIDQFLLELRCDPALRRIGLPGPCPDLKDVRHGLLYRRSYR